ncbi:hypothetical protein LR48_Vigan10g253600 [Vigna angularis]|uniref:Uncharacterized protein n=1 Tax=Phaseolus angularis TaxID=3914 RepID=A0A0L9VPH1_PHAAN|nr:hypothetical protein LR48_Vigan10g253600 [Vigna angularis]
MDERLATRTYQLRSQFCSVQNDAHVSGNVSTVLKRDRRRRGARARPTLVASCTQLAEWRPTSSAEGRPGASCTRGAQHQKLWFCTFVFS